MNQLRVSRGLQALVEDPIINTVAQSTAEIMAANQMTWHIGDVSGRLAAAGYGGGTTVWATENFATGNLSIDQIMVIWSDASHMIPAVNPAYCNVGAGVARASNGRNYYVLQAAYTSANSCGEYISPGDGSEDGEGAPYPQIIVPVKIATSDGEGIIYHVVEAGQTFWAIAIAYQITIQDLEIWNNLSRESQLQIGQRLFIPGPDTEGYSTPTPVGMIQVSTPDAVGKIIHEIQAYQTLTTIAQAYGTTIARILTLNAIQIDWPLLIGQKLIIDPGRVTPSPTTRPLTPIEKLTPASDGNYYHIIKINETLSWIAALYEVLVSDLMAWNGLSESSIIQPEQNLILHVTPPTTATATAQSMTATLRATLTSSSTPEPIPPPTSTIFDQEVDVPSSSSEGNNLVLWLIPIGLVVIGIMIVVIDKGKKKKVKSNE
jgi:LysM repeat protein